MFDELKIQPNLQPNLKDGRVEGFEDFGFKKSDKIANHAQIFMLQEKSRFGTDSKVDVCATILVFIYLAVTVCDQGANNQAAINMLVKKLKETIKEITENCIALILKLIRRILFRSMMYHIYLKEYGIIY